jgi:hypothetical protein
MAAKRWIGALCIILAVLLAFCWAGLAYWSWRHPLTSELPEVALQFVTRERPALVIQNTSEVPAKDIKRQVAIWNMDNLPPDLNPLQIPIGAFDWLKGHQESLHEELFPERLRANLAPGNRLIGSATVDCPTCGKMKTYVIYIIWEEGGWYSEVNPKSGKSGILVPIKVSKEAIDLYFRSLENLAPPESRIPIEND